MLTTKEETELANLTRAIAKKIEGCLPSSEETSEILEDICREQVHLKAGSVVVAQDGAYGDVFLIESGWALRSRHLESGARQIVNVVVPGDFLAFNAVLLTRSDFELRCKTDISAFRISSDELNTALGRNGALSALLFWINGQEESMLAERVVSLGRRSARQRAAHVICEIMVRVEMIEGPVGEVFTVPLSQDEFADILGISVVHMNKTFQALRRDNILSFRNSTLTVFDRHRLEQEAGFEDGYLHFTRRNDWRFVDDRLIANS